MQGEGGGTPPEKGTRLARAECNDSLEEKRKTGRTRRKIGGTVEKQGERENVCIASNGKMHPRQLSWQFFIRFPPHQRCEHLFAVYEAEGTSDIDKRRHFGAGNANKVHSVSRVTTGCRGLTYPHAPFLSYDLNDLIRAARCSGVVMQMGKVQTRVCKWKNMRFACTSYYEIST